jgi:hypothetical protein
MLQVFHLDVLKVDLEGANVAMTLVTSGSGQPQVPAATITASAPSWVTMPHVTVAAADACMWVRETDQARGGPRTCMGMGE